VADTLTKAEYEHFRGDASEPNGSVPTRHCEVCSAPLKATQKHVCSPPCAGRLRVQRLGGTATKGKKKARTTDRVSSGDKESAAPVTPAVHPDGLLVLLASLPDDVVGIDLAGGWRVVRA
jgi:hypothetical protein